MKNTEPENKPVQTRTLHLKEIALQNSEKEQGAGPNTHS